MGKMKILICDDEEGVRESLRLIIPDNYDLEFAKNGDEAIEKVKGTVDLKAVLLDIKMPKKNGIDVLKNIKSHNKDLPVIIITGYQSVETASEAVGAGASEYIAKPFETEAVLKALEDTLS